MVNGGHGRFSMWIGAGVLAPLALVALTCGVATAETTTTTTEEPQSRPVVRVEATTDAFVYVDTCVSPTTFDIRAGDATLARTGSTAEPLTIQYDLDGPVENLPGEAVFAEGSRTAVLAITPKPVSSPTTIELRVAPDDAYDLGDPATATVPVRVAMPSCLTSTTASSTTTTTVREVGEKQPPTDPSTTSATVQVMDEQLPRTGAAAHGAVAIAAAMLVIGSALLAARHRFGSQQRTP